MTKIEEDELLGISVYRVKFYFVVILMNEQRDRDITHFSHEWKKWFLNFNLSILLWFAINFLNQLY